MAAAAIPAAPLMLRGVAPRLPDGLAEAVGRLRDGARSALQGLEGLDTVLVIAGDDPGSATPRVLAADEASLDGLGVRGSTRSVTPAHDRATRLGRSTGWPLVTARPAELPVDLASLLLQLEEVHPDARVVPVVTTPVADPGEVAGRLRDTGLGALGVLVAGDLSAGLDAHSPRPSIRGAGGFDGAAVTAVRRGDAAALALLGPGEAVRVHARGWLPLTVLHHLVDRPADSVTYRPVRGVGQVVAGWGRP